MSAPPDPAAVIRSRRYVGLLVLAAAIGAPVAAAAYFFLKLIGVTQHWVYSSLPDDLGLAPVPHWWPLVPLCVAGLLVGVTVRLAPGGGGELPLEGFKAGGAPVPATLPGIAVAAFLSIALGAAIGPEGPLVALGSGLAYVMVGVVRTLPLDARKVLAASGAFAAISTLMGTPLAAAFLLLEASGLGGATATAVLLPGMLAAGIGALIFTGLDTMTGFGTFSLAIPNLPAAGVPTAAEFGYAIALGAVAAGLCWVIRQVAVRVRDVVARKLVFWTTMVGAATGLLAWTYASATGHATSDVLFSGQSSLPGLVDNAAGYSVGALLLLMACKGLAYAGALVAFRGGPTFPAMFLGAAGGIAASHLPGLGLIAGVAIGLGAMAAGMLRLPLTAVLLATLFLGSDGFAVIPLTVVAVVVCHVLTARLTPPTPSAAGMVPAHRTPSETSESVTR